MNSERSKQTGSPEGKTLNIFEMLKLCFGTGLKRSARILFSNSRMIVIYLAVILITLIVSILLYYQISSIIDKLVSGYSKPPELKGFFDYFYYGAWGIFKLLFNSIITSVVFFISFIISYILCSPLYSRLSNMAEDIFQSKPEEVNDFSMEDYFEEIKKSLPASGLSIGLIILAFFINFIPVFGQIAAFFIILFANSLLLNDFVTSEKNWNLKTKLLWLKNNFSSIKIGCLPAFISIIPIINSIILAFLFPILIVAAALNFYEIEKHRTEGISDAK